MRPLTMGRASAACNDTTRVSPSGTPPPGRNGVRAALCSTSPAVRASSLINAGAWPPARPARRSARAGVAPHGAGVAAGAVGDRRHLSVDGAHLVFGVLAASPEPGGDV